jgi:hypothetical protein
MEAFFVVTDGISTVGLELMVVESMIFLFEGVPPHENGSLSKERSYKKGIS